MKKQQKTGKPEGFPVTAAQRGRTKTNTGKNRLYAVCAVFCYQAFKPAPLFIGDQRSTEH
ncbi:hypothetical protein QN379_03895 [Glaciimonas sp. Gout2]|uniref:hypothetical protein n=1 Tax=unclassified Glaciimonas TaxID=2644401 RepID=UPI002AB531D5|nr:MULTISPECIES: hypothetical protein [unclassified Glaciimonas]MDY7546985.1 hypothetical protein [Glaciimonas sp. CA11.2]MEB0011168.1 hypothetical protein [Glaciimonas sp. Cout2]MEB0081155.1 hypothetical protein [Glaciimonas sp. Gout2]